MKGNSDSVWRTVLLAAFMCLAAGEAYGYKVWKSGDILVDNSVLLVENGKEIEVDDLLNQEGIVVIAMGASVKLDQTVQIQLLRCLQRLGMNCGYAGLLPGNFRSRDIAIR